MKKIPNASYLLRSMYQNLSHSQADACLESHVGVIDGDKDYSDLGK